MSRAENFQQLDDVSLTIWYTEGLANHTHFQSDGKTATLLQKTSEHYCWLHQFHQLPPARQSLKYIHKISYYWHFSYVLLGMKSSRLYEAMLLWSNSESNIEDLRLIQNIPSITSSFPLLLAEPSPWSSEISEINQLYIVYPPHKWHTCSHRILTSLAIGGSRGTHTWYSISVE